MPYQVAIRRRRPEGSYVTMRDMIESIMEDFLSNEAGMRGRFFEGRENVFERWPQMRTTPFEWRMEEFMPFIDVSDEEEQIRVKAEMPGVDASDLELTITSDSLILKGEKKEEQEEQGYCYRERCFGPFQRIIPLPFEIDRERIQARFKDGLLTVILPKARSSIEQSRKIDITTESEQRDETPQENVACDIAAAGGTKEIKRVY